MNITVTGYSPAEDLSRGLNGLLRDFGSEQWMLPLVSTGFT